MFNPAKSLKSRTRFAQLLNSLSMGGWVGWRGRSISRLRSIGRLRSVGRLRGGVRVLGVPVVDLLAHLLRQGQLDSLAGRSRQLGDALLEGLRHIFDLRDGDALLLGEVLARDPGEGDGLVHTGLDGLGVDDIHGRLNNGDNGDVVASLLSNLLAVVVAVAVPVAISMRSRLADSHHLGLANLLKGHLNCLSSGGLSLGLVGVGADLVVDLLSALGTDGADDGVALLDILDALAAQFDGIADGLKGGGADLGSLDNIEHGTVVFRVFVPVVDSVVVCWSRLVVRWLGVVVRRRLGSIASVGRGGRGIASIGRGRRMVRTLRTKGQGGQGQQGNKLGRFSIIKNKNRLWEIVVTTCLYD